MKNTAVLLINCPDQKGIVAKVAQFLYEFNANILHADEHIDNEVNLFFLRVEWDLTDFKLNKEDFKKLFSPLAKELKMDWKVKYSDEKQRVVVLVSQQDHCLWELLYRYKNNQLFCEIPLIISNHPNAKEIASFYKIPFKQIDINERNKVEVEKEILALLKENNIDLVILARYMQILSEDFIKEFSKPIINIHHSFLPSFVGAKPYHQAYARGVKIIGATAHFVTANLDQGPIIEQDILRVSHRDSVEDLVQKGKDIEKMVLSRAVKWYLENKILTYSNKTVIFD